MSTSLSLLKKSAFILGILVNLPSMAEPVHWELQFFDEAGEPTGKGHFHYDSTTAKCTPSSIIFLPCKTYHNNIDSLSVSLRSNTYNLSNLWWNDSSMEPSTGSWGGNNQYVASDQWTVQDELGRSTFSMQEFVPLSANSSSGRWSSIEYGVNVTDLPVNQDSGDFTATRMSISNTKSYFDGAGSIIQTGTDCWGCDKDEARMHPHHAPSTVVFQWTAEENCPYLEISSPNVPYLKVDVHSKLWNDSLPKVAYHTVLPVTVANRGYWNTTAITSREKLLSKTRIIARCAVANIESNHTDIDPVTPVIFYDDFDWSGNGSIISKSAVGEGTGITRDWVHRRGSSGREQYAIFQWQSSERCQSLKIEDTRGPVPVAQVDIKGWSEAKWGNNNLCGGYLPCTVGALVDTYQIVRIRMTKEDKGSDTIQASCQ